MLPKRLFLGILLLTAMLIVTGCSTTGKSKEERFLTKYRNAGDECIRWGHVRESDGYHRCIYTILGLKKYLVYDDIESEYEKDNGLEVECRLRTMTGSRISRRVCTVEKEWAKLDQKNQDAKDEFERDMKTGDRTYIPPISTSVGLSAQMGLSGTTVQSGPMGP